MPQLNKRKVFTLTLLVLLPTSLFLKKTELKRIVDMHIAIKVNNFFNISNILILLRTGRKGLSSAIVSQSVIMKHHLVAMTDKLTYSAGDEVSILISSLSSGDVSIYKINSSKKTQLNQFKFKKNRQHEAIFFNSTTGFKDQDFMAYKYRLSPKDTGWIQITVKTKTDTQEIPIFVDSIIDNRQILFVESTDTMKAYVSAYDMKTHYSSKDIIKGTFTRPHKYPVDYKLMTIHDNSDIDCREHLANADFVIKDALDKEGVKFNNVSDDFLKKYKNIKSYKSIILGAHNEYWSAEKILNIQKFIDNGGRVLILGGNTSWRFIETTKNYDFTFGDGLLGTPYKSFIHDYLGSHYDTRGYATSAPFVINKNIYKLLTKKQSPNNNVFGVNSDIEHCRDEILGASGHETDKILPKVKGFDILATGSNKNNGGADIIYKSFDSGGKILNFGSVGLWHKISDPVILKLITRFL